ncbi:alpha/beta fold hydrolase [Brachybacterium sp. AOP35-5H-19]|uniref:alpha/beta fold hydrolase n=1 Tax=Brachybacterium sp. AOP35-5H-19 TaxID=3457685 RepID=UPI003FB7E593
MHTQGTEEWITTRDGRRLYSQVLDGTSSEDCPASGDSADASVTVVFEAGYAAQRSTWAPVQTLVAEFARTVVYDRSGLGRSTPDPGGRSLDRMAADLGDVLDHHGPGPFLLVGHSAGGPIVRAAAASRSEQSEQSARSGQIAGLVLVDPNDEAADFALRRSTRALEQVGEPVMLLLATLGLLKPLFSGLRSARCDAHRGRPRRPGP